MFNFASMKLCVPRKDGFTRHVIVNEYTQYIVSFLVGAYLVNHADTKSRLMQLARAGLEEYRNFDSGDYIKVTHMPVIVPMSAPLGLVGALLMFDNISSMDVSLTQRQKAVDEILDFIKKELS